MTQGFGEIDFDVILGDPIQNLPGSLSMWPTLLNVSEQYCTPEQIALHRGSFLTTFLLWGLEESQHWAQCTNPGSVFEPRLLRKRLVGIFYSSLLLLPRSVFSF